MVCFSGAKKRKIPLCVVIKLRNFVAHPGVFIALFHFTNQQSILYARQKWGISGRFFAVKSIGWY